MQPLVTLTTDFGFSDGYVGTMHGVIWGICPDARIVSLAHDIEPQNLRQGAFVIHLAHRYFPAGTVHVVVVDPGVGSTRRAIAMRTKNAFFVAPDNGILSHVLATEEVLEMIDLTEREYWLPEVSQTFHGRDIFAPVGAHIAAGVPFSKLGRPISDPVTYTIPEPEIAPDGTITGHVLYVDRFGNLITDVPGALLEGLTDWDVEIGGKVVRGICNAYSAVQPGELLALVDASGNLEIAQRNGSAALAIGVSHDGEFSLRRTSLRPVRRLWSTKTIAKT
jgi:S-adenosylmethionine hydrolase